MSRKRLSLGLTAYALDKVVVSLVQILMVPVLANAWGLTLYGIWAIMMTVPTFLGLGDFGIVASAGARMVAAVGREEWSEARRTLHTAWLATLAIIAFASAVIAVVLWALPDGVVPTSATFDEQRSRLTLMVLLAYGLATIIFRLNTAAFRAALKYSLASLCSTGVYLAENLAVIILVAMGKDPLVAALGLLGVRLAWIGGLLALSAAQLPQLAPGLSQASRNEWAQMWRPALAASALGFGLAGYLQGSVMILGALAGAAAVPAFIAVRTISRLGVQVSTLVSMPVMQEFGNVMGRGDRYKAGRYFGLVAATAAVMAVGVGIGLVVLGAPFIALWTRGAITADTGLLIFMAISSMAAMLWNPLSNLILAINRQNAFSYANLVASGVGILVIWFAAPSLGAASAGLSFAFVDAVTLFAVIIFIMHNWHGDALFRSGAAATIRELRSPISMLRSLNGSSS